MIRCIYNENDVIEATTTGCGCCSNDIYDKEEIMNELRGNLRVLQDAAQIYELTLDELIAQLES